jgi:hypothetical protein
MKRLLTLTMVLLVTHSVKAQSLSFNQLNNIYNLWKQSKGTGIKSISSQLSIVSPKWKLKFIKPIIEDDSKCYLWTYLDAKQDTTAIALYVEEDNETLKYSLKYVFHKKETFNLIKSNLQQSGYKGQITISTDNSKGETSITALDADDVPLPSRIDYFLVDYNLHQNSPTFTYTVDLTSRFIKK